MRKEKIIEQIKNIFCENKKAGDTLEIGGRGYTEITLRSEGAKLTILICDTEAELFGERFKINYSSASYIYETVKEFLNG
jgi:hypothetical protein